MANIILRPIYNRPEMLYLSLEYEKAAREYYSLPGQFVTLFLVEAGTPQEVLNVVQKYPYESVYEFRPQRYGLTVNILDGMAKAFKMTDDYVVYIEDDILIHNTYFKYMDLLMNMPDIQGKYSILSPFTKEDVGSKVSEVYQGHHYAALAPLIPKEFYYKYIAPHSIMDYYKNEPGFIVAMDRHYKEKGYQEKGYKYDPDKPMHWQQAGLINRLTSVAMIEEDKWIINPYVNRQIHIGFVGINRPGGTIPGQDFDERIENLREIIKDADKMYELTAAKQYNDYKSFSSSLEEWDSTLKLSGKKNV